jgi:Uma2 family endonuclease
MSTVETKTRYTPEDLLAMPDDGKDYELVDGELVERNMGWYATWIGGRLYKLLTNYCDDKGLGWTAPGDASYQCFPDDPKKVRKADVSFIRIERLSPGQEPQGHCRIPPDLAVEVVSPNDLYSEVEAKVGEYLGAGVRLVWVIDPPTRSVRVHRANGTVADLEEEDELSGEEVIPGFRCRVGELFAAPTEAGKIQKELRKSD